MLSSNISKKDFFLELSRGNIPGASYFYLSAYVGSVNNVELVVRPEDTASALLLLPDAAGESMEVVSNSAADASPSGAGARTVNMMYLDTDFLEQTLSVSLNGVTPVPLVPNNPLKPIVRINRLSATTFGPSTSVAAGNIDVRKVGTTTTNIYRRIAAGDARASSSLYTVPANKQFFLQEWHFACAAATAGHYGSFKLYTNGESNAFPVLGTYARPVVLGITQDAHDIDNFPIPLRFLPKADIYSTVVSDTGAAAVRGEIEYYGWFEEIS